MHRDPRCRHGLLHRRNNAEELALRYRVRQCDELSCGADDARERDLDRRPLHRLKRLDDAIQLTLAVAAQILEGEMQSVDDRIAQGPEGLHSVHYPTNSAA